MLNARTRTLMPASVSRRMRRSLLVMLFAAPLALAMPLRDAGAQTAVSPAVNAAVARARTLNNDGDDAKWRALLDSLVNSASRDSFDAAEALYWRAQLNDGAPLAELDWKRIVVEVPFSPRASEALLKLSELDLLHANRTLARQHVQQLLSDYPAAPERPRALIVLARSYFDDRDAPRACGVLTVARREAPLSAVELRLQADELQQQCRNVREVAMGAAPDSTTTATPVTSMPPLSTQTAALPPAKAPVTPSRGGRSATAINADSVRRDSIARVTAARNAARLAADSIRRDSVARVMSQRTVAKLAADSVRRDSIARVIAQHVTDSTRRDSVTKAGFLRAAAQRNADNARIAENARRDSISRAAMRRDSVALDSTGRNVAVRNTAGSTNSGVGGRSGGAPTPGAATNPKREVSVFISDSARADSLARDAAALEIRIHNAVAARDSVKRDSVARAIAKRAADAKAGKWTVQIAAYQTRADADAVVKRLSAKDISARVVGSRKPYRVQVGRYATRADAAAALATLKKNGQKTGFVAEIGK